MAAAPSKTLSDRVRSLVASVVNLDASQVPTDAMAGEFAPWTSLAHIEIMMGLEAEFGVSVPTHLIADLMSIELIADFLRTKGVEGGG